MQSLGLGREEIVSKAGQLKVTSPGVAPNKEKGEIWEGSHFSLAKKGNGTESTLVLCVTGDDLIRKHVIRDFRLAFGNLGHVVKLSSAPNNETVLWSSWNTE